MILALDVGNSQIYAGVFDGDKLRVTFRKNTKDGASSDEVGLFLRAALRENDINPEDITQIAICSVVPEVVYSLRNGCIKYFKRNPFLLQAGVKTGLKIKYRNPLEVGADRIANAIAATHLYPGRDLLIVDFGTAATFCAINAEKEYLGGVIVAGPRIQMEALESKTAKLPSVEILAPKEILGRSTVESIQSGLFYGQIGAIKEISQRLTDECFHGERPYVIGTGGFSTLFDRQGLFDVVLPDLVLKGLVVALQMNA
jgi:type III pantothenate kinase